MFSSDAIGWFIILAPVLASAGGFIGALLVQNHKPTRDFIIGGADYLQAITDAVEMAETYGVTNRLPGAEKLAVAVKQMDKWLDDQGIHGDAKRVTTERVLADIELVRAKLQREGWRKAS